MADYEKIAITLRTDDKAFVDDLAQKKAVGRSAVIRWALDHYRAFLISSTSTYRIDRDIEDQPTETAA